MCTLSFISSASLFVHESESPSGNIDLCLILLNVLKIIIF